MDSGGESLESNSGGSVAGSASVDLLFSIAALRLDLIAAHELLDAAASWGAEGEKGFSEYLVSSGALEAEDGTFIEGLLSDAAVRFGDDGRQVLSELTSDSVVEALHTTVRAEPGALPSFLTETPALRPDSASRYTEKKEHGRGGMGRVYIARDSHLSREVALKELSIKRGTGESNRSSAMVARFLREARVTGQLEHPSIVPVYEIGAQDDGTPYYTMRLVRGDTLAQAIDERKTLEDRLALLSHFLDLCQAIAFAQSRGIVHRDVKPSNVLIGEYGETVVIDWGLAKVLEASAKPGTAVVEPIDAHESSDPSATAVGSRLGTPQYMAPEQANGLIDQIDERTDVFALGIILYQLLTGRLPFDGDTSGEVYEQVVACDPTPISEAEPGAPGELVGICARALHKDPRQRYSNAKEMAEDVERFQAGAYVQAYEYTTREILFRFYRRYRLALNTAVASLVLMIALALAAYASVSFARDDALLARDDAIQSRDRALLAEEDSERSRIEALEARDSAEESRGLAEAGQYVAGIQLAQLHLRQGRTDAARSLLENVPAASRDWEWGYLVNKAWPIQHDSRELKDVEVAPGLSAATRWSGAHPSVVRSIDAHDSQITGVSFSSDGELLATKSLDGSAQIWDVATGEARSSIEGVESLYGPIIFSGNNRYVCRAIEENGIGVCEVETGKLVATLAAHTQPAIPVGFSRDDSLVASVGIDQVIHVWDWRAESIVDSLPVNPDYWSTTKNPLFFARFTRDGKGVVTFWDESTVRVWRLQSNNEYRDIAVPKTRGIALQAISPDLESVISVDRKEGEGLLISLTDNEVLWKFSAFLSPGVQPVRYSPDGSMVYVRTENGNLLLFDLRSTPDPSSEFVEPVAVVSNLSTYLHFDPAATAPDNSLIAIPERDGRVRLLAPARQIQGGADVLLHHRDSVLHAHFERDARFVVAASFDGIVRRWDVESGSVVGEISAHSGPIHLLDRVSDSGLWVTSSFDQSQKVIDMVQGEVVASRASSISPSFAGGPRGPLMRIGAGSASRRRISADGLRRLQSDGEDLIMIETKSGEVVDSYPSHGGFVHRPEFTPDESKIVAHGFGQSYAKVWDVASGSESQTLQGTANVLHTAVSNDSRYAATAHINGSVLLWDLQSGIATPEPEHVVTEHTSTAFNVDFDRSSSLFATASADSHVRLWRVGTWEPVADLNTHTGGVLVVRFSPTSDRILTGAFDDKVRVFDFDGNELATFPVDGVLADAEWSQDGYRILASTMNGVVHVWSAIQSEALDAVDDDVNDLGTRVRAARSE